MDRDDIFMEQFIGQRSDETVLLMARRHWTILFVYVLQLIGLHILPVAVVAIIFWLRGLTFVLTDIVYLLIVLGFSLYYIGIWLIYFHAFTDYHLDIWIVTNQRILDIQQHGLFNRIVAELNMTKVEDVTSEVRGKMQTVLNFGNIYVQTAGEQHRFIFQQVPHPQKIAEVILHMAAKTHSLSHEPAKPTASAQ